MPCIEPARAAPEVTGGAHARDDAAGSVGDFGPDGHDRLILVGDVVHRAIRWRVHRVCELHMHHVHVHEYVGMFVVEGIASQVLVDSVADAGREQRAELVV